MKTKSIIINGFAGAIAILTVLITYGIWIEPYDVEVHQLFIKDVHLAGLLENRVVVQLSDLHINRIGFREKEVLRILDELKPDIIFLTGDYSPWKTGFDSSLNLLSQLHAKIGIWAVMGDYDYSNSRKSCLFCHEEDSGKPTVRHQVRFLRNSSEVLRLPEGLLRLAGIDGKDPDSNDIYRTFSGIGNDLPMIVLCHNPLMFNKLPDKLNFFMLSGDTHGGQLPLPSWLFRILGYEKNALFNQGLFESGNKKMFVSRGIGWSHVPIRLFRRPEVVVFHFSEVSGESMADAKKPVLFFRKSHKIKQ